MKSIKLAVLCGLITSFSSSVFAKIIDCPPINNYNNLDSVSVNYDLSIKFHKNIALGQDQAQTWITYDNKEIPSDNLGLDTGVTVYAYSVRKNDSPIKFLKNKEYKVELFNMTEEDFEIKFVEKNPSTIQNQFSFYGGKGALNPSLKKTLSVLRATSIFDLKCTSLNHNGI